MEAAAAGALLGRQDREELEELGTSDALLSSPPCDATAPATCWR